MQEKFTYEDGPDAATRIVVPHGELDATCADGIRQHVEQALVCGKRCVILDLSETTFIESAALAALTDSNARVKRFGAEMRVVVPADSGIRRLFLVTRLDKILRMMESREEALLAS